MSERRSEYLHPVRHPLSVAARIRRLREAIMTQQGDRVLLMHRYVSALMEAFRSLAMVHPQALDDLDEALNEVFRQRFETEWTFGRPSPDTLDDTISKAVQELMEKYRKRREKEQRIATEATIRREIEMDVLRALAEALETVLIRYAYPP